MNQIHCTQRLPVCDLCSRRYSHLREEIDSEISHDDATAWRKSWAPSASSLYTPNNNYCLSLASPNSLISSFFSVCSKRPKSPLSILNRERWWGMKSHICHEQCRPSSHKTQLKDMKKTTSTSNTLQFFSFIGPILVFHLSLSLLPCSINEAHGEVLGAVVVEIRSKLESSRKFAGEEN